MISNFNELNQASSLVIAGPTDAALASLTPTDNVVVAGCDTTFATDALGDLNASNSVIMTGTTSANSGILPPADYATAKGWTSFTVLGYANDGFYTDDYNQTVIWVFGGVPQWCPVPCGLGTNNYFWMLTYSAGSWNLQTFCGWIDCDDQSPTYCQEFDGCPYNETKTCGYSPVDAFPGMVS